MLLAIDTSTAWAGIALHGEDGPEAALRWRAERSHTVQLVPWIDRLMASRGVSPVDLSGLAVATGPGSFTGVRVGLATAKGIAASLGVPLVGVPTLYYTAWPHRSSGLPIRAVLTLGRDRLGVAAYEAGAEGGLTLEWERNLGVEEAVEAGAVLYCGELSAGLRARLAAEPGAAMPEAPRSLRDPAVLAALGWERLRRGEVDSPEGLQARYLER
jgi:tRNA threonylcarbamoyladenosine biosynthesis protein TsaB